MKFLRGAKKEELLFHKTSKKKFYASEKHDEKGRKHLFEVKREVFFIKRLYIDFTAGNKFLLVLNTICSVNFCSSISNLHVFVNESLSKGLVWIGRSLWYR